MNQAHIPTLDAVVFERYTSTAYKSMHGLNARANGSGATYIPLRRNKSSIRALQRLFLNQSAWEGDVIAIPSGARKSLAVALRPDTTERSEYLIKRQFSDRHPAWGRDNGFPENDEQYVDQLVLYLARTTDGSYYAGFLDADQRARLPESLRAIVEEVMMNKSVATSGWVAQ